MRSRSVETVVTARGIGSRRLSFGVRWTTCAWLQFAPKKSSRQEAVKSEPAVAEDQPAEAENDPFSRLIAQAREAQERPQSKRSGRKQEELHVAFGGTSIKGQTCVAYCSTGADRLVLLCLTSVLTL